MLSLIEASPFKQRGVTLCEELRDTWEEARGQRDWSPWAGGLGRPPGGGSSGKRQQGGFQMGQRGWGHQAHVPEMGRSTRQEPEGLEHIVEGT